MPRRLHQTAVPLLLAAVSAAAFAAGSASLWLDVPFVRQEKDGCSAACVSMVMQYWERHQGKPMQSAAEPRQIFRALYARNAQGIFASAMVRYLQQNHYRTFVLAGEAGDLERQLSEGRPLIAAVKPDWSVSMHFVVIAGLDGPNHLVLINDPAQRKLLKEDTSQFEREWKATGNWLLLALPLEQAH